jgi:drug/metabolite transporter (DMT)-like permease
VDSGPTRGEKIAEKRPRAVSPPLLLVLSAVLFALMAVVAKRAAFAIPGPEVAFVRFAIGLLAVAVAASRVRLRAENKIGLLLRGLFGGSAVLLFFLSIEHLQVGIATLLNNTAPVFTAIWATVFLRERPGLLTLGALLLTTLGVVLVLDGTAPPGTFALGPWHLVGLASAVLSGAAVATIREVRKTDGPWEILAAFCVMGMIVTAVPTLGHWVAPSPAEWGALLLVGVLSVGAQLLMTYALRYVRAAVASVIGQLNPVTAIALGWLLFGDSLAAVAVAGVVLTLSGVAWGAYIASQDG